MNFFKIYDPAPHLPEIEDVATVKKEYKYWRIRILYSMFIGYALYYFTRKSFTFAMPGIVDDLGYNYAQLGILTSVWAVAYGFSKFFGGLLSDRSNPRFFMATGLICTGLINIFFGLSSSLILFVLLWGLNGWFQGFGWPPCARFLTHWYSHSERGTWWCIFGVSHNVGGFLIPWIVGFCLYYLGWRWAMYVPGIICLVGGLFLINRLRDTPQSIGLPSIEKFRNDYPHVDKSIDQEKELTTRQLIYVVLTNKFIWLLCIAYFFVHIVRGTVGDWTAIYLIKEQGFNKITASGIASLFEMGGAVGNLCAGLGSDRFFKARRNPVNAIFLLIGLSVLILLSVISSMNFSISLGYWIFAGAVFALGFSIFGPQLLIGVAAAELTHKKAAATATGFIAIGAYTGAALTGYPLGLVIDNWGWEGCFVVLFFSCLIPTIITLSMWNVSYVNAKLDLPEEKPQLATQKAKAGEEITYA